MKRLITSLVGSALLAVTAAAQTPAAPAAGTLLEIQRLAWGEFYYPPSDPAYDPSSLEATGPTEASSRYRSEHRAGRGKYFAVVRLKNVSGKTIKSVGVDFVFRETETEREFLTYHLDFDRKLGPGQKKEVRSSVIKGRAPGGFTPVAPGPELLARTAGCGDGPLALDPKTRKMVRIRDSERLLKLYPCFYLPVVTRIEFTDGSSWRP